MIKIGMMIGNRYEILEKIGTGGMSDVYKAKCHKLNRFVAVKVLKQEFSENTAFVSKFRAEAQAAAGLMHPNIVNVYDVGEENGINYIVMELVEGITLKKYIEKKARLSVKEAVSIAIQVSMGIEAAHNNRIIHRDIKPQNIIISKEGKVKVTDFGIAKAATSQTITSNVMGSVHYTSPEQARGGFSDEKSDIYSLGITLFEMLTGRVPFNGETTVAIAIKHIQEEMPSPRQFVPEIPISVEQIVMKCTQKSPDRRYQNMGQLIEDLKKSLISPDENFVKLDDDSLTKTVVITPPPSRKIRRADTEKNLLKEERPLPAEKIPYEITKKSVKGEPTEKKPERKEKVVESGSSSNKKSDSRKKNTSSGKNRTDSYENKKKKTDDDYDDGDSQVEKITSAMIVLVAVVIGIVLIYFSGKAIGIFEGKTGSGNNEIIQNGKVKMINVIGLQMEDARDLLNDNYLGCTARYVESEDVKENEVISASVKDGDWVEAYSTVEIIVSAGAEGVTVPSVLGKSEAEATATLEKEGFKVTKEEAFDHTVGKGLVISQTPTENERISFEGTVNLVISKGKELVNVQVPTLLGKTEEEALAALEEAGLTCSSVTTEENDNYAAGLVCYQNYSSGAYVSMDTGIEIRVSEGPEMRYFNVNLSVDAPSAYTGGSATVRLVSADGMELFNASTESFPVAINLYQLYGMPFGTVSIDYIVYEQQEVVDMAGTVTVQNVPKWDNYSYEVKFE